MLRINRQTDYGILLLARFAAEDDGRVLSARDLAAAARLPQPTVQKVLKALARGGLVTSQRGVRGGYALARRPEAISLAEIILALEGPIALTECGDEAAPDCSLEDSCRLRVNWQRINRIVRDALTRISLAEMVDPPCAHINGFGCLEIEATPAGSAVIARPEEERR